MANVPNVQFCVQNTSSTAIPLFTVNVAYSDHYSISCYAHNVPSDTTESLVTINSGTGNNHKVSTSATVSIGGQQYTCNPKDFTAKEGMVCTYSFNGDTLSFST